MTLHRFTARLTPASLDRRELDDPMVLATARAAVEDAGIAIDDESPVAAVFEERAGRGAEAKGAAS